MLGIEAPVEDPQDVVVEDGDDLRVGVGLAMERGLGRDDERRVESVEVDRQLGGEGVGAAEVPPVVAPVLPGAAEGKRLLQLPPVDLAGPRGVLDPVQPLPQGVAAAIVAEAQPDIRRCHCHHCLRVAPGNGIEKGITPGSKRRDLGRFVDGKGPRRLCEGRGGGGQAEADAGQGQESHGAPRTLG